MGITASTYGGGRFDGCSPRMFDVLELLMRPRGHDGKCAGVITVVLAMVDISALRSLCSLRSLRSFRWLDERECHRDVFS